MNSTIKLPSPNVRTINNVTQIGPYTISGGEVGAAGIGFQYGAEVMANMFTELLDKGDMTGLLALSKATQTNTFYDTRLLR